LRRQYMLDFRSADAVREAGEGAMRAGVRVAADHGHARQRGAVFRADDMDDALVGMLLARPTGTRGVSARVA
jgi:hypothetical protein